MLDDSLGAGFREGFDELRDLVDEALCAVHIRPADVSEPIKFLIY